jgi:hypothetical protein
MSVAMNFMNLAIFSFTFVLTSNAAGEEGSLADAKIQKKKGKKRKSPSNKLNTRPMPMWSSTRNSCSCCCPQTF